MNRDYIRDDIVTKHYLERASFWWNKLNLRSVIIQRYEREKRRQEKRHLQWVGSNTSLSVPLPELAIKGLSIGI